MAEKKKKHTCPTCEGVFIIEDKEKPIFPFCSKRCKIIDLGKWLGEKYSICTKD